MHKTLSLNWLIHKQNLSEDDDCRGECVPKDPSSKLWGTSLENDAHKGKATAVSDNLLQQRL